MRATRPVLTIGMALAALLMPLVGPVSAGPPAGARFVDPGNSIYPKTVSPLLATSAKIVYATAVAGPQGDQSGGQFFWMPTSGGAAHAMTVPAGAYPTSIAGSVVTGDGGNGSRVNWWNLSAGTHGHGTLHHVNAGTDLQAFYLSSAPDGWLSGVVDQSNVLHLFDSAIAGGQVELTAPTNLDTNAFLQAVAGPSGAVITDGNVVDFVYYNNSAEVTLNTTGYTELTCTSVGTNAAGCEGLNGVSAIKVLRVNLDAITAPVVSAGDCATNVSVTSFQTGWIDYCGTKPILVTVPSAGGSTTSSSYRASAVTGASGVFAIGVVGSHTIADGLYTASDASVSPTRLLRAPISPRQASGIAIAPGRIGYGDDRNKNYPVFSRTLSTGGKITIGAESLVASHATDFGMSISGAYTAFALSHTGVVPTTRLVGRGQNLSLGVHKSSQLPPIVSGTRLLYYVKTSAGPDTPFIYDVVTGNSVRVAGADATHGGGDALWGNYVAFFKPDGSIWRRDLSTRKPAKRLRAGFPSGNNSSFSGSLYEFGDYVGWSLNHFTNSNNTQFNAFRNAHTMAGPVKVGNASTSVAGVTSDGVVVAKYTSTGIQFYLRRFGSPTLHNTGVIGLRFVADQSRALWLTSTGQARVGALPHVADPPRFLGNPIAPGHFTRGGGRTWKTYLPSSASLTKCHVDIRSGSTTVRTLPCSKPNMKLGDAVVAWNGKNSSGQLVPAGTYSWRLVAKNGDGVLRTAAGRVGPATGSVTVA